VPPPACSRNAIHAIILSIPLALGLPRDVRPMPFPFYSINTYALILEKDFRICKSIT